MKILVTGAGGFIGSHLVDRLKLDGHEVIGLDKKFKTDWIRGNQTCDREMASVDIVHLRQLDPFKFDLCYHLAAESRIGPSFQNPLLTLQTNVTGTGVILDLCQRVGARMAYAGSSTADDNPYLNPYATSKWEGEHLCRLWYEAFKLPVRIARFYNVYGPREMAEGAYSTVTARFLKQYADGKQLTITGDGEQRRDFIHVSDVVDGLVAIAERGFGKDPVSRREYISYSLGTGESVSILQLAMMITQGDLSRITFIPRPPGELESTSASVVRTETWLNWKPQHALAKYLEAQHVPLGC